MFNFSALALYEFLIWNKSNIYYIFYYSEPQKACVSHSSQIIFVFFTVPWIKVGHFQQYYRSTLRLFIKVRLFHYSVIDFICLTNNKIVLNRIDNWKTNKLNSIVGSFCKHIFTTRIFMVSSKILNLIKPNLNQCGIRREIHETVANDWCPYILYDHDKSGRLSLIHYRHFRDKLILKLNSC